MRLTLFVMCAVLVFAALDGPAIPSNGRIDQFIYHIPAASSSCTVTFIDSLGYTKPQCYSITEPAVTNEYWVDLSSGSGTTCSQASPCTLSTASGKTGVSDGGGAYVHVKGTGAFGDPAIRGSSGHEVVITTWPAGSTGCASECTATFTGESDWTTNKQWMIIDGGPNQKIQFIYDAAGQFDQAIYWNASPTEHHDIIIYRTLWQVVNSGEWMAMWGGNSNVSLINNEFHALGATDTGNQHHIYISGCGGLGDITGLRVLNNIFRDTPGESMEMRLLNGTFVNDVVIDGNAFHDIGKGTCGGGWQCRPAINTGVGGGGCAGADGSFGSAFRVSNNLFWDTGDGALVLTSTDAATAVYGNTIFNWGSGASGHGSYSSAGITNFAFNSSIPGDIRNNVLYATGTEPGGLTKVPFPGDADVDSFNACRSGVNCGTSSQENLSAGSFLSLDETNANFLKMDPGATTVNNGTSVCSGHRDYFGTTRPQNTTCDIGAHER